MVILFDINDLFADIFETTKMVEQGNTLLVPPSQWSFIMSTPRSTNSDTTIAQYIVNNSPYINSMEDIIAVNECQASLNPELSEDALFGLLLPYQRFGTPREVDSISVA